MSNQRKRKRPQHAESMTLLDLYSHNKQSQAFAQYVQCIDCDEILLQQCLKRHYTNRHKDESYTKTWRILKQSGGEYLYYHNILRMDIKESK